MKKRKLKKNEYQCAICKGIFDKGWSDKEAAEEFHDRHPELPLDETTALICDPCYEALMKDIKDHPEKYEGLDEC